MASKVSNILPRVYVVRSPLTDMGGNTLVLDYTMAGDGTVILTLAPLKDPVSDPTAASQRFRVYPNVKGTPFQDGRIQNEALAGVDNSGGFLTRESPSSTATRVILVPFDPKNDGQQWNYGAGPMPLPSPDPTVAVPGAGPHGSDRYTIVTEPPIMADKDGTIHVLQRVFTALVVQQGDQVFGEPGQPVLAVRWIPPVPPGNRLPNQNLFFFNWIEGH